MSDLGNFAELANVKASDVKRPVPVPEGHYTCLITGLMKPHKARSGNQAMRFPFKVVEPGTDVDPQKLADYQAAGGTFGDKEYTYDFWMSPDARFRFTEFTAAMGLGKGDPNLLELAERLATSNKPFTLQAKHEWPKDEAGNDKLVDEAGNPTVPFVRWDNPAPAA